LGRTVKLVRQYFKEGLNVTDGYIFVKSSAAIFAMGVSGITQKTLSDLSPQATLANFTPPGQVFFGIRGKITQSATAAPVAGVTLTLSRLGTPDQIATTDATGEYLFKNLMPNTYILKPTQAGQMFAPVQVLQPSFNASTGQLEGWVVNANSASQQADFVRESLPTLSSIEVVTNDDSPGQTAGNNPDPYAIFGTSEVSLKLTGTNFASGQNLFFRNTQNGTEREVPITSVSFVDPTTMFVRLALSDPNDALQLAVAGRYDLSVSGQIPFGDTRSNVLPFYVVPPLPVITDVAPRETYARYEVNSQGLTITVRGFGFRQGARVEFNGTTGVNGIEVDTKFKDSTLLEAFLPPQALRFGGLYLVRVRNVSELPEVSGEAISFQINNLRPEIYSLDPPGPLSIIGPGPVPVTFDLKINGSNFFPKTTVAVTQKIPDIFPAIVPVGGTAQCIPINGRSVLRVRVYNTAGQPAPNVSVTFTAPSIVTTEAAGSFPGGAASVTVVSDGLGFAPPLTDDTSTLLTANPFAGSYAVEIKGTVDGFALIAVISITNLAPTEGCTAQNSSVQFVSSNQIIVKAVAITSKGTYSVVVANPSPGGGYSSEKEFVVTAGPSGNLPTISPDNPLSPPSRGAGSGAFNLTVFGSNFQADAWVNFGTVRLNRIAGDSSSITVTVPALLVPSLEIAPVTVPVTVTNPGSTDNTGGTSDRALFLFTK
jgi:hypothetical protein